MSAKDSKTFSTESGIAAKLLYVIHYAFKLCHV